MFMDRKESRVNLTFVIPRAPTFILNDVVPFPEPQAPARMQPMPSMRMPLFMADLVGGGAAENLWESREGKNYATSIHYYKLAWLFKSRRKIQEVPCTAIVFRQTRKRPPLPSSSKSSRFRRRYMQSFHQLPYSSWTRSELLVMQTIQQTNNYNRLQWA